MSVIDSSFDYCHDFFPAPTGVPQAVLAVATGSSSIYVQWDCISCVERNSEITGYTIHYAPSDGVPLDITILGTTRNDRTFTMTGLSASTYYTVMVAADTRDMTTGPFSTAIPVKTLGKYSYLHGTLISSHFNTLKNDADLWNVFLGMHLQCSFTMNQKASSACFKCFQNVVEFQLWILSFVYVLQLHVFRLSSDSFVVECGMGTEIVFFFPQNVTSKDMYHRY